MNRTTIISVCVLAAVALTSSLLFIGSDDNKEDSLQTDGKDQSKPQVVNDVNLDAPLNNTETETNNSSKDVLVAPILVRNQDSDDPADTAQTSDIPADTNANDIYDLNNQAIVEELQLHTWSEEEIQSRLERVDEAEKLFFAQSSDISNLTAEELEAREERLRKADIAEKEFFRQNYDSAEAIKKSDELRKRADEQEAFLITDD